MKQKIEQLHEVVNSWNANSPEELEAIRIKYLSKKGEISELFNQFREVPNEQKREMGQLLNHLRDTAQNRLNELKAALEAQRQEADKLDLTRTAEPIALGTRHPLSLVKNEIIEIFSRIGFTVAEGPEIEDDWHVFESLNFPPEHPARDMQDTFFIEQHPDILLRTHTSSIETRVMTKQQPPHAKMSID